VTRVLGKGMSIPRQQVQPISSADEAPGGLGLVQLGRRAESARASRWSVPRGLRRLSGPLILVIIWQLVVTCGVVDAQTLPGPIAVIRDGVQMIESGGFFSALWISVRRVLIGLVLGIVAGMFLALVAGMFRLGEDLVDSTMQVLRAIPVFVLSPLLIVWLGIGEAPKYAMVAIAAVFPIYLNTYASIRGVDAGLVEMTTVFGAGRVEFVRRVVLPASMPGFFVGLRFSLAISWLALIFAEQINATNGLGYLLSEASALFRVKDLMFIVVVYGVLGFLSDAFVRFLERRVLIWRRSFSGA
jgi:sulfonate transport system permease protein